MIAAVQDYYRDLYDGPDRSPVEPAEFAPPDGRFFVGYLDGTPVAMGGWRHVGSTPGIDAAQPAEIKRMYVAETARGRGLARQHARPPRAHRCRRRRGHDGAVDRTGRSRRRSPCIARQATSTSCSSASSPRYEQAVHLGKRLDVGSTLSEPRAAGTAR